jgi:hypothetical protein
MAFRANKVVLIGAKSKFAPIKLGLIVAAYAEFITQPRETFY